ncbi:MAG: DUF2088 domain-containing protein [Blastocatellia bacterium]|nr:DUF2088 domain-containing protein [Blastocatellia bacterium]
MQNAGNNSIYATGKGSPDMALGDDELRAIVRDSLASVAAGTRVLAIIPDKTRDDNTHVLFPAAADVLAERSVAQFDALVAQGTHSPMSDEDKLTKIGGPHNFLGTIFDHK